MERVVPNQKAPRYANLCSEERMSKTVLSIDSLLSSTVCKEVMLPEEVHEEKFIFMTQLDFGDSEKNPMIMGELELI